MLERRAEAGCILWAVRSHEAMSSLYVRFLLRELFLKTIPCGYLQDAHKHAKTKNL